MIEKDEVSTMNDARERLEQLLDYVAALGGLKDEPVYSWRSYKALALREEDFQGLEGVKPT